MNRALVVYGTCSGNAELVAQAVQTGLVEGGLASELKRAELTPAESVLNYDLLVLVCSTWNVGQLQDHFIGFHKELSKLDLQGKPVVVVGLGDSKNYDIFCGAADILEETVGEINGKLLVPTLRIDGPPHADLDKYHLWGKDLAAKFAETKTKPAQITSRPQLHNASA